jgi:transcriptional regulator with XRE-family HTH domain
VEANEQEGRRILKDDPDLQRFAARVKQVREAKGMTQEDLAYSSHISVSQVSRIERGVLNPSVVMTFYLARALKVPVAELFQFELSGVDD